jgi:formiminotetrahydrofolate cyclodeaminase
MALAYELPQTHVREEKQWRKQDIRNARALAKSAKLAAKHYPDGIVEFDQQIFEDAYDMPDDTKELAKIRRKAMKAANKQKNLYGTVAGPYLAAKRIIDLAEGYANLDTITKDYEDVVDRRNKRHDAERADALRIAEERRIDKERKEAEKRIRKR